MKKELKENNIEYDKLADWRAFKYQYGEELKEWGSCRSTTLNTASWRTGRWTAAVSQARRQNEEVPHRDTGEGNGKKLSASLKILVN
jgi:hypothetical protein